MQVQIPGTQQLAAVQYGALPLQQTGSGVAAQMVVVAPTSTVAAPAQPAVGVGALAPGTVAANAARPMATTAPGAPRQKKRKFGQEKTAVQEKVSTAIPESPLYNQLLEMDSLVTDMISRRKADFKEPFPPYHEPVKRVLRIAVQASYAHQPAPPKAPTPPPAVQTNAAALAAASAAMFAGPSPASPQKHPAPEPPSWVLTVSGHLVDPADQLVRAALAAAAAAAARGDPSSATLLLQAQQLAAQHIAQQQAAAASGATRHTLFTAVMRRVEVVLDPDLYPGELGRVAWDKGNHTGPQREAIEVRRQGSRTCKATVLLWPDYQPERYVLPPLLAEVLGMMAHETRSRIMVALYGFIKSRRLQDPKNPINVKLTPELAQSCKLLAVIVMVVFGCRTLKLSDLGGRLSGLLQPVPPVRIEYNIKLDDLKLSSHSHSHSHSHAHAHHPGFGPRGSPTMASVLQGYYKEKEIEGMDAKLANLIRRLNECRRRRALLLAFAHSPVDVTYALLAAQAGLRWRRRGGGGGGERERERGGHGREEEARDVRMARQGSGRDYELERRTEVFRQRWVEDAVMNYLHKRLGRPEGLGV
ncbi:hypothetical protein VOLCADRAFT_107519 [Volvox carteri f. nagariensis]|uniref:DM2 domain-containing protein n=1 Tax=Volvox carteri f. nagariensis TaxID=3068 RepID=D8UEK6_VOLCA|nr:uncharacterized protein VOLCADRAFT_107519 [Volvox carteri f. nagariensis]EFJ41901.1 hypothetical protein VOLCADRAFT_107519 [Volvox carteri f. nagariensis]|eukprot:XP_002957099.1 hypothetical protein VOLCADRAFT_107519 [Volvox carteri f. nagariensis]